MFLAKTHNSNVSVFYLIIRAHKNKAGEIQSEKSGWKCCKKKALLLSLTCLEHFVPLLWTAANRTWQEISPVCKRSRGQSPQVQALLSDNFQWKVYHTCTPSPLISSFLNSKATSSLYQCDSFLFSLGRGTQLRSSVQWFSGNRPGEIWLLCKLRTGWKKSPHLGPGHVFQCSFPFFWQVDGGNVSGCYSRTGTRASDFSAHEWRGRGMLAGFKLANLKSPPQVPDASQTWKQVAVTEISQAN